jgi:tetratricopeptide (TPR) repeat protein
MKKQARKAPARTPSRAAKSRAPAPVVRSGRSPGPRAARETAAKKPIMANASANTTQKPLTKPVEFQKQQQAYDEAIRLFHHKNFERADALFRKAMGGPDRSLAHHAQIHSQICQKRVRPPAVDLKTAEDHYNYAITMINARRLKEAAEHLQKALQMAPHVDYMHYALAATAALQGNGQGAYESLKRAVEIQPRNRQLARTDADFAGVLDYAPLATLLQIDRGWSRTT